jgi:carbonic anhydrase
VRLSAEQIQRFRAIIQGNDRPVQPLNGRIVATERTIEER